MEYVVGRAENVLDAQMERLEDETTKFAKYCDEAADSKADFKKAWAKVFLETIGTGELRRVTADFETAEMLRVKERAEGREKSQRQKLDTIRTNMEASRTIMASARV